MPHIAWDFVLGTSGVASKLWDILPKNVHELSVHTEQLARASKLRAMIVVVVRAAAMLMLGSVTIIVVVERRLAKTL